jgi:hypothetical protein
VTVVIGVATVTVEPTEADTVAVVIGVLTPTVAATVTGNVGVGSVGKETVGNRSARVDCGGGGGAVTFPVDDSTATRVASPVAP